MLVGAWVRVASCEWEGEGRERGKGDFLKQDVEAALRRQRFTLPFATFEIHVLASLK